MGARDDEGMNPLLAFGGPFDYLLILIVYVGIPVGIFFAIRAIVRAYRRP